VKAGSSYLSQNDVRVHVGLGAAAMAGRCEVKWPDGRNRDRQNIQANQLITIREGEGLISNARRLHGGAALLNFLIWRSLIIDWLLITDF
jgi:hypothetical protein